MNPIDKTEEKVMISNLSLAVVKVNKCQKVLAANGYTVLLDTTRMQDLNISTPYPYLHGKISRVKQISSF